MEILASSNAVLTNLMLIQHQAVINYLHGILDDPTVANYSWLDIACGRGQIINQLSSNLSPELRAKLSYQGFDGKDDYIKSARKIASELTLKSHDFKIGYLNDFPNLYSPANKYDLITFTNTIHEIAPKLFGEILFEAILRLSPNGILFIYDMESLDVKHLELGAVTWNRTEIQEIVNSLTVAYGIKGYVPSVALWPHKTCNGWSVQIQRRHLNIPDAVMLEKKQSVVDTVSTKAREILERRFESCCDSLESHTNNIPEIQDEKDEVLRLMFELWGLHRAKEKYQ